MKASAWMVWGSAAAMMAAAAACGPLPAAELEEDESAVAAKGDLAGPIVASEDNKSFVFNGYIYVLRSHALAVATVQSPGQLVSLYDFGAGCAPWRMAAKSNFLFVATNCGTPVLDISNPANITEAGAVTTTPNAKSRYVRLNGNRLYLSEYLSGWTFSAHDVSTPAQPQKLGERRLPTNGSNIAAISVPLGADRVAVHAPGSGTLILDVSNPAAGMPTVGVVASPAAGLAVKGTTLYLLKGGDFYGSWAGSVETWNVANPAAPVRLGRRDLGRIVSDWDSFTLIVRNSRTYVFVGGDSGYIAQDFVALDVTDPSNPSQPVYLPLWLSQPDYALTAADIDVVGSVAYVYTWKVPMEPWIGYEYFLVKVDITNPLAPVLLSKTQVPPFGVIQQQ